MPVFDIPFAGLRPPLGVHGVGHITAAACARIATRPAEFPASFCPFFAGARLVGVAHIAAATCRGSWSILLRPSGLSVAIPAESFQSRALAVIQSPASALGDEPDAVTAMWRVDGTSRDNDRPPGVSDAFQVSEHSVEPTLANRCRNLLSHDDSGPSGTDETKEVGPQVPIIVGAALLSCDTERLARRGAGPQLAVIGPAGESGGECPSADAGEEMALRVACEVIRCNVNN